MSKVGGSRNQTPHTQQVGNPAPKLAQGEQAYTVKQGDTMSGIARQHDMSLQVLQRANPQIEDASRIWPGDQIRIPGAEQAAPEQPLSFQSDGFDAGQQADASRLVSASPAAPLVQQSLPHQPAPEGTTTAAQLAAGLGALGGPTELATRATQEGAALARTGANAARGRMAQVFAEGGEEALRATRAHQTAARLETTAARATQSATRLQRAGGALNIAAGALTAVDQFQRSEAQSTVARTASAGGAGTLAVAVGARHPYFAAADAAAQLLGAPDTPSNIINRSVDTIATVGEGVVTGDIRGMDSLHQSNLRGDNGPVFQAAAEAGDFWAEHGVVGGLSEFGGAVGDAWDMLWD